VLRACNVEELSLTAMAALGPASEVQGMEAPRTEVMGIRLKARNRLMTAMLVKVVCDDDDDVSMHLVKSEGIETGPGEGEPVATYTSSEAFG
jgi:hypothetical protein